jgi:fermentation-respiration switch protein FrsA (DUF1100 family)
MIAFAVLVAAAASYVGIGAYTLAAPDPALVGDPPSDPPIRKVDFDGVDGARLRGWFVPADRPHAVIVLMHGIRANRVQMLDRARFLHREGYAVLLYDSRAHGESTGRAITFGYLESRDARIAIELARSLAQTPRAAIIGVSLGGAAAILAGPPLEVNALVLESVYPTIDRAIANRLRSSYLGRLGPMFTPVLTTLFPLRLGFPAAELRPVDHVSKLTMPKLFIFGTADQSTTMDESLQLYAHAAEPKQVWPIDDAGHIDLCTFAGEEYRQRVLQFLAESLH